MCDGATCLAGSLDGSFSDASDGAPGDATAEAEAGQEASTSCFAPPPGIVSWWRGEGNADDFTGNNNGTTTGTYAPGMVGQGFAFDGATDGSQQFTAGTSGMPTGSADRTIEMWAKATTLATMEGFLGGYGLESNSEMYEVFFTGFQTTQQPAFSQWGLSESGPSVPLGAWVHVAATSLGSVVTLYVNASLVAGQTFPMATPTSSSFHMGFLDPTHLLNGVVDEVTVYDRALYPAEIGSIYGAGSAGKCH